MLAGHSASAATFFWDGGTVDLSAVPGDGLSAGGNGNWDTGLANWDDSVTHVVWPSSGTDNDAVFGGAAGTVTLQTPIAANDLTFNTTGYTIAGTVANALTLNGTTANVKLGTGIATTITATLAGSGTTLNKAGAGILTLSAANTYSGVTTIAAGTLKVTNATALGTQVGSADGTFIASGATLDNNGVNLGGEMVTVSGAGVGGLGAIVNNSATDQLNALRLVTMNGDTTFGGTARWDIRFATTGTFDMGGFTLTKTGVNTTYLTNLGTVLNPGPIVINGGLLGIETSTNIGATGSITVNTGGTLAMYSLATAIARPIFLNSGTVANTNGNASNISGPVTLTGVNTFAVNLNGSTALSGLISGTGSIINASPGAVALTGLVANTYAGGTVINNGIVSIGTGGTAADTSTVDALGTGSVAINAGGILRLWIKNNNAVSYSIPNPITLDGGTIRDEDGIHTVAGPITVNSGGGTFQAQWTGKNLIVGGSIGGAGGVLVNSSAAQTTQAVNVFFGNDNTYAGTTTVTGRTATNPVTLNIGTGGTTGSLGAGAVNLNAFGFLTVNRTNAYTIGNAISGAGGVFQSGTGTTTLSGPNSFTGGITLNAGTLSVGTDANLGDPANAITFNGGILQVTANTLTNFGAHTRTFTAAKNVGFDIASPTNTFTVSQVLNQTTGGLTKNGPGTLALTTTNTFTGAVTLNGGTIDLSSTGNLALGNATLINGNGGTINATGGGQLLLNIANGDIGTTNGNSLTINAVIANGTQNSLDFYNTSNGTGVVVLTANNTFDGTTNIQSGIVSVAKIGDAGVLGNLGTNGTLSIGSSSSPATLRYTGTGETNNRIINLAGTGANLNAILDQSGTGLFKLTSNITAAGASSKALVLQGSTAGTGEISGSISDNSPTTTTGLTKTGTGSWRLSGTNTYTGDTNITGGTLFVSGSIVGNIVNVNSGGTLSGSFGTVGGTAATVTVGASGTIAPGNDTIGLLNVGAAGGTTSLLFAGTSGNNAALRIRLDSTSNSSDLLFVNGNLDLSSAFDQLTLTVLNGTITALHTYTLATYTGTLTGTFNNAALPNGGTLNYGTGSNSSITLTVVPEPATALSLLGGMAMLLGIRRRRA